MQSVLNRRLKWTIHTVITIASIDMSGTIQATVVGKAGRSTCKMRLYNGVAPRSAAAALQQPRLSAAVKDCSVHST